MAATARDRAFSAAVARFLWHIVQVSLLGTLRAETRATPQGGGGRGGVYQLLHAQHIFPNCCPTTAYHAKALYSVGVDNIMYCSVTSCFATT